MMPWHDVSEIVAGLVVNGTLNPNTINPDFIFPPYDTLVTVYQEGGNITKVVERIGVSPIQTAQDAVRACDNLDADWLYLLESAARRENLALKLERAAKKLRDFPDEFDETQLYAALEENRKSSGRYITLDQIEDVNVNWRQTFYPPIDTHIGDVQDNSAPGGFPEGSLVVIGGTPGTGKTSLLCQIASNCALNNHRVLIYTFEMRAVQIARRLNQLAQNNLMTEQKKCITICDTILTPNEVYADAMLRCAREELHFIGVDFMDLMISGDEDEPRVASAYKTLTLLAKQTNVPVILISQLNRRYETTGGVPRINHLRWSGLAEALSGLILLLHNPNQVFTQTGRDERLPIYPGRGYIIVGKSRFGYREGGTGAIQVDFNGASSWGEISYGWTPLGS